MNIKCLLFGHSYINSKFDSFYLLDMERECDVCGKKQKRKLRFEDTTMYASWKNVKKGDLNAK